MLNWKTIACRDEDPELFFPVGSPTTAPYQAQLKQARAVCARCPVVTECLTRALEQGLDHGVFGGLDEHERRDLKRRHAARRAATADTPATAETTTGKPPVAVPA